MKRARETVALFILAICAMGVSAVAGAQNYPAKPVRIITGFTGGSELMARMVAQQLSPALGQQVLVDVRLGAAGNIGFEAVARSAPDIAGKNIANPYALIMSGQMLLEWLGRKRNEPKATKAAQLIDAAVDKVIAEAKHLTGDLGGKASTAQMEDAVAAAI